MMAQRMAASELRAYATGLLYVSVATGIGWLLHPSPAGSGVRLCYVVAVLLSAVRDGLWPSLATSLLSTLALDFFFIPPIFSLTIASADDAAALAMFGVVAVIVSNLVSRTRAQAVAALERARTMEALLQLSTKLAAAVTAEQVLSTVTDQISLVLQAPTILLIARDADLVLSASSQPEHPPDEADIAAAVRCWHDAAAGETQNATHDTPAWRFMPMHTTRGIVGVLGVARSANDGAPAPERRRMMQALADQAALAIERIALAESLDRARLAAEGERLLSTVFASVSHDLRTPLHAILAAASELAEPAQPTDMAARRAIVRTIREEAERLNRCIANMFDMTRIESGVLTARRNAIDLGDVVSATLRRCRAVLAVHRLDIEVPATLPMVLGDEVLLEHVLFNLLDNAAKYAPAGSLIRLSARVDDGGVLLSLADEGRGMPPEVLPRVFDKFYRGRQAEGQPPGMGLGLAICRGFVEAMGGVITASNRSDRRGALFCVRLPLAPVLLGADLALT